MNLIGATKFCSPYGIVQHQISNNNNNRSRLSEDRSLPIYAP